MHTPVLVNDGIGVTSRTHARGPDGMNVMHHTTLDEGVRPLVSLDEPCEFCCVHSIAVVEDDVFRGESRKLWRPHQCRQQPYALAQASGILRISGEIETDIGLLLRIRRI